MYILMGSSWHEQRWMPGCFLSQLHNNDTQHSARLTMVATVRSLRGLVTTTVVVLVFGLLMSLASAYPDPGACSGNCYAHDPSVVKRADGTYFRFNTGGGIQIYKASSLEGSWTYEGDALPSGSSINLSGNTDLWVSNHLCICVYYMVYMRLTLFVNRLPW